MLQSLHHQTLPQTVIHGTKSPSIGIERLDLLFSPRSVSRPEPGLVC